MAKKRLFSLSGRDGKDLPLTDCKIRELIQALRGQLFIMKDIIEPYTLIPEDKHDLEYVERRIDELCAELLSRSQQPNEFKTRMEWK